MAEAEAAGSLLLGDRRPYLPPTACGLVRGQRRSGLASAWLIGRKPGWTATAGRGSA